MIRYKKFKLGSLFDIESVSKLDEAQLNYDGELKYDYVTRTSKNNGIEGKTARINNVKPNEAGTFSLGLLQMTFFYRERPWYGGQFVKKITPKFKITNDIGIYFMTIFNKISPYWVGMLTRHVNSEFLSTAIELPVDDNQKIDWQYMTNNIENIKKNRLNAFYDYLSSNNLNNHKLSFNEQKLLQKEVKFKKFKIGANYYKNKGFVKVSDTGIFNISPTKAKINANTLDLKNEGRYPYVARGSENNGIRGYTNQDEQFLNPAATISFGQDTATMFFQPQAYLTGDKIQIFQLNSMYGRLTENIALYLITSMKKVFKNFEWGQTKYALDVISSLDIKLPLNEENNIDFEYMENYIQAIKHMIISKSIHDEK